MKIKFVIILFLIIFGGAGYLFLVTKTVENSLIADVHWKEGGMQMQAIFWIIGNDGKPLSGVKVAVENNSGFCDSTTDDSGRAVVKLSEAEVQEVRVGERIVLSRPNKIWIIQPKVTHGLIFNIMMKVPIQKTK